MHTMLDADDDGTARARHGGARSWRSPAVASTSASRLGAREGADDTRRRAGVLSGRGLGSRATEGRAGSGEAGGGETSSQKGDGRGNEAQTLQLPQPARVTPRITQTSVV